MVLSGGPKGSSRTLAVAVLTSMSRGAASGSEVTNTYEELEHAQNIGHLFGVLPIRCFEPIEIYKRRMDKAIREIRGVQRAPGVERIYLPGEREQILAEAQNESGIPIKSSVWAEWLEVGRSLDLAV